MRETPHAISWAKGLPDPTASASELAEAERWMALLGVYNGHASGVGRVVVDSTWHHWMDINLLALEAAAATATVDLPTLSDKRARNAALEVIANYDKIVRYFINIAIWLAPPTKQHWMLHAATGWAVTQPRSKQDLDERTPTEMAGQLAAETLARQVGPCQLDEWLHLLSPGPKPRPHWPPAPLTWPRRFELLGSLVKELLALSPEAQSHGLRPLSSACSPHRESSAAGSDATDPARA